MSLRNFYRAWYARGLNPIQKLTLMAIAKEAGEGVAVIDVNRLAASLECNETRVERTIRRLVLLGWIARAPDDLGRAGWKINRP